jgi:hypothetical protein
MKLQTRMESDDFSQVNALAGLMSGFDRPWFVAGGWAVDLYLGRFTRPHDDIEVAIFRDDQHAMKTYLAGWVLEKAHPGRRGVLEPWQPGERLELPVHEIHARREGSGLSHLEILLNEASDGEWKFRRNLSVTRPIALATMRTQEGMPFLGPEIALLYKANDASLGKNAADFANVLLLLDSERRVWLRHAISTCYSGHPWLQEL